jgi:hypothetical protein
MQPLFLVIASLISFCHFELEKSGDKTKLRFLQTDVPENKVESIKE